MQTWPPKLFLINLKSLSQYLWHFRKLRWFTLLIQIFISSLTQDLRKLLSGGLKIFPTHLPELETFLNKAVFNCPLMQGIMGLA